MTLILAGRGQRNWNRDILSRYLERKGFEVVIAILLRQGVEMCDKLHAGHYPQWTCRWPVPPAGMRRGA